MQSMVINVSISFITICSAWELLGHQDVTIEKLAATFPDQLAVLLENLPVARRLEIEGIIICVLLFS